MAKSQKSQPSAKSNETPQKQSQELSDSQTPTTPESPATDQTQNPNSTTVDTKTPVDSSSLDESATENDTPTGDGSWTLGDSAVSPGISTADSDGEHAGDGEVNDVAVKPAEGAPAGHIIRLGEEVTIPATVYKNHAVVSADVFKERKLRGSKRVTYVQVYTAGTAIPLTTLQQK